MLNYFEFQFQPHPSKFSVANYGLTEVQKSARYQLWSFLPGGFVHLIGSKSKSTATSRALSTSKSLEDFAEDLDVDDSLEDVAEDLDVDDSLEDVAEDLDVNDDAQEDVAEDLDVDHTLEDVAKALDINNALDVAVEFDVDEASD